MQELVKVFDGIELRTEKINDKEFMIDVSGIAKRYGKNITDWKNKKETLEYIEVLGFSNTLDKVKLFKNVKIKGEQNKVMIHNKMLISFARFISPKFAVWCDDFIYSYLIDASCGEVEEKQKQLDSTIKKLEEKEFIISEQRKIIEKNSERRYAKRRSGNLQSVVRIIKDYNIAISAEDLNQLLVQYGLLDWKIVEQIKYTSDNMNNGTPIVHTDTVLDIVEKEGYSIGNSDSQQRFDFN